MGRLTWQDLQCTHHCSVNYFIYVSGPVLASQVIHMLISLLGADIMHGALFNKCSQHLECSLHVLICKLDAREKLYSSYIKKRYYSFQELCRT